MNTNILLYQATTQSLWCPDFFLFDPFPTCSGYGLKNPSFPSCGQKSRQAVTLDHQNNYEPKNVPQTS